MQLEHVPVILRKPRRLENPKHVDSLIEICPQRVLPELPLLRILVYWLPQITFIPLDVFVVCILDRPFQTT